MAVIGVRHFAFNVARRPTRFPAPETEASSPMRFYEYEAREVVRRAGIPVTDFGFARTAPEARAAAERIGGPVVIKSQVLTGGRMKAGGVQFADTPDEAERRARDVLDLVINGHAPRGVLVDPRADVAHEYYAGVVWDGIRKRPVLLFSDMGGIDIEEVAETHPDHVGRGHFSTILPLSDFKAKEVVASVGVSGSRLNRLVPILTRLARLFLERDLTLAEVNPLCELADGSFVALDAHVEMENEARGRQQDLLEALGVADTETRQAREPTAFELAGEEVDAQDHRGVAGNVTEFDGDLGLVIGAGGGSRSLTLFDAVRAHGGRPANYCEIGGNPSVSKACGLAKLVLQKPGVDKIAVMMSIVSNTRVDIVARGVIRACLELGYDPAEKIAIFRIPGAWEEEGFKILEHYGVEYADRSVSMHEAARRAVEKIQEDARSPSVHGRPEAGRPLQDAGLDAPRR
jgi:succinyl-CoA synthetase beta subunit